VTRSTSATDADRGAMLAAIGAASIDELFAAVPERLRLRGGCDLPAGLAEQDVFEHLRELAARTMSTEDEMSFLGAGMDDHDVPAVVDMLTQRSELPTPTCPTSPRSRRGRCR